MPARQILVISMHDPGHVELLHLVARAADGARPLRTRAACADLWQRLGARFDVIACVLMPDHVHLLARVQRALATRAFAQLLSSFRARSGIAEGGLRFEWEPIPRPEKVQRDPRHIARTIRYIHLNPCRDGLCDDPLEWEWSTHRDWVGAIARPCVDVERWGRVLRRTAATRTQWLHEYVCSDPSVRRSLPVADVRAWLGRSRPDASLATLADAVARVRRSAASDAAQFGVADRRLFVLAAGHWTRYSAAELARWLGRDPTSVRRRLRAGRVRSEFQIAEPGGDREMHVQGRACRAVNDERKRDVPGGKQGIPAASGTPGDGRSLSAVELRALALTLADARLRA